MPFLATNEPLYAEAISSARTMAFGGQSGEEKLLIVDRLRERDQAFRAVRRRFADPGRGPSAGLLQSSSSQQSTGGIRLILFGANLALLAAAGITGPRR